MAEKDILRTFGQRVREIRRNAKLSQEQLAESTNLHPTYISMIERGKTNPTLGIITKIAKVLHVNPGTLISNLTTNANPEIDAQLIEALAKLKTKDPQVQLKLLEAINTLLSR